MSKHVRIAVVGDGSVYRQLMGSVVAELGYVLSASASTLSLARTKLATTPVDLVVLDVQVAGERGADLLPWLRSHQPQAAVAMLTAEEPGLSRVDALLLGATTLAKKPTGPDAAAGLQALLRALVEPTLGPRAAEAAHFSPPQGGAASGAAANFAAPREVVAVGASTGGPPVVTAFVCGLSSSFAVPVMITQHMPSDNVPAFVASLAQQSGRVVRMARHLTPLLAGEVVVAGDGRHMRLGRRKGALVVLQDDGPEEHYCRPAVNPLFVSVAETCRAAAVGVVMTGMGSDGATGAARMAECGAALVVQDRQTSAVWGMPGAVVAAQVPCQIVPAAALSQAVMLLTHGHKRGVA